MIVEVGDRKISLTKPVAYQEREGKKEYVVVRYVEKGEKEYGFEVGNYDHNRALIIDPLLSSTFLGGAADEMYSYDDFGGRLYNGHRSMAEDSAGNIYVITSYSIHYTKLYEKNRNGKKFIRNII